MNKFWKVASLVSMLALSFTLNGCSKDSFTLEGTLVVEVGHHTKNIFVDVCPYEPSALNKRMDLEEVKLTYKENSVTFTLNAGNYLLSVYSEDFSDIRAVQVRAGKEVVLDYTNRLN